MDNYFELYSIPVSFHPDNATVKERFYELSRKYHPDRYTQADQAIQMEALQISSNNNKAYKTLTNADATMEYVLLLTGAMTADEKYNLPPAFLMEVMEINEALSEYEHNDDTDALQQAKTALEELLEDWQVAAHQLTARFTYPNVDAALLAQIKDMYFRKKYLLRIRERMVKFAAR